MIATFLQGNIAGRCGGSWSGCATAVCDSCAAVTKQHLAFASNPYFNNSTSVNVQLVYR